MTYSSEQDFLNNYDLSDYPSVGLTVDLTVFTIYKNELSILLIEREDYPDKDKLALPGGFINKNQTLKENALSQLQKKVGLVIDQSYLEQLGTYGDPGRDKRGYIVSTAYVALVPSISDILPGEKGKIIPIHKALDNKLAFDHRQIILDGLERVRAKLEYAPLAHHFIPHDVFTMSELRHVYEIVWGTELTPGNFRRKVQSVEGFVETVQPFNKEDRSPALYRAGSATNIYPPIQRRNF